MVLAEGEESGEGIPADMDASDEEWTPRKGRKVGSKTAAAAKG